MTPQTCFECHRVTWLTDDSHGWCTNPACLHVVKYPPEAMERLAAARKALHDAREHQAKEKPVLSIVKDTEA